MKLLIIFNIFIIIILSSIQLSFGISRFYKGNPVIPFKYELYLQCDPKWGNNLMGGSNPNHDTICIQGCAMSSLSMALNGKGFKINSTEINPGTMNTWLKNNKGYTCINNNCNNLVLNAPDSLSPHYISFISEKEKPSIEEMKKWITKINPIAIAHVHNKGHFVLVTGYDKSNSSLFYVNDPFYPTNSYDYTEISDILLYYSVLL